MLTHTCAHTHMQPKAHRAVGRVAHLMGILMSVSTVADIFPPFWFDFVLTESFQYFETVKCSSKLTEVTRLFSI